MIDSTRQDRQRKAMGRALAPALVPIRVRWSWSSNPVRSSDSGSGDSDSSSDASSDSGSVSSTRSSASLTPDADGCYRAETAEDLRRLLDSVGDEVVAAISGVAEILKDPSPARTPAARVERIAALEKARAVLAAAQLGEELAFTEQQRAEQEAAGVKARNLGRGIAEQVGFARRITPSAAARHIGLAAILRDRLPQAWLALKSGDVSEDQVQILANRTSHLSDVDATLVDAGISPRMSGWNKKQTEQAADRAAYEIDPQGSVARRAGAEKKRRVWISPSSDCMAKVTALLPTAQAVGVYAQLKKTADSICGVGDEDRTRDQVMADTLVTRITGQEQAHLVPVDIRMTITEESLLRNGSEPAFLDGIGPIPAEPARSVIAGEPPGNGPSAPDPAQAEESGTPASPSPPRLTRVLTPRRLRVPNHRYCPRDRRFRMSRPASSSAPRRGSPASWWTRSPGSLPTWIPAAGNSTASSAASW